MYVPGAGSSARTDRLVTGGLNAVLANSASTSSLVTIDRDGNTDASLLSLTQSNGSGGVASSKPALTVSRYTDGGGSAIFGGAYAADGVGGSIVGGEFLAQAGDSWDPTNGLVIGMKSDANAYGADEKCYGANVFAWAIGADATDATIVGIEVDLGGRTGSTVAVRYGVQVVSPDLAVVQATGEDVAYRVAAKSLAATFKTGFLIDHNGGKWPIDATGTLFDARTGTVTNGIDFSTMTFTGATFKGPATNINGVGRLRLGSSSAATGTMFEINAVGDETYNMVFSNAVSAGSAGSVAEYMTIRFNGNTRKIALLADS